MQAQLAREERKITLAEGKVGRSQPCSVPRVSHSPCPSMEVSVPGGRAEATTAGR